MSIVLESLPSGNTTQAWVYFHLAADGSVLYIGQSIYPRTRHGQHRSSSPWWSDIDRVELIGPFPTATEARDYEAEAIREHQPPNNVMHTDRHQPRYYPRRPVPSLVEARDEVKRLTLALAAAERRLARLERAS